MQEKQIDAPEEQKESNLFLKVLGYSVVLLGIIKDYIFPQELAAHWFHLLFAIVFFLTMCGLVYSIAQRLRERREKEIEPIREIRQEPLPKFDWDIAGTAFSAVFSFILAATFLLKFLRLSY